MSKTKILLFVPTWLTKSSLAFLLFALALLTMPIAVTLAQSGGPELTIPDQVSASPNNQVTVPVTFTSNGHSINSVAFSVDYDETWLTLDPTDSNNDGIPDAVTIPTGFLNGGFDTSDTDGELDIAILVSGSLPDGQIASITFDVGNPGSTTEAAVGFSSQPSASFGNPSGGPVTGTTDNGSVLINVSGPTAPVADFTCTPTSGEAPLTVTCTDASTGDITGWSWDFGDGTTSTDQNPAAHTYSANGSYDVALTVTGSGGSDTQTRTGYISVGACVPPAGSNVCIDITSGGELAVESQDVAFLQTSIAGSDVLAYAIDKTWVATDTTNLGAGWHVTLIAEDHLRGSQDPTNRVIPVGTTGNFGVQCDDSDVAPVPGVPNAGGLPTCASGVQSIPNQALGETAVTILTATVNDGRGAYTFVPHFQLLVPGTTILDIYTTNIYVDIIP